MFAVPTSPSNSTAALDALKDTTIACRIDTLHPHPSFTKHCPGYSTREISTLSDRGESVYLNPLIITQDGLIVEGSALWHLARLQHRTTLPCIVRNMNSEEALIYIIEKSNRSTGLNDYVRILIALELEPWFRTRAKSNQQQGGKEKGSTLLTEAERLDVRQEIADAAGVAVGNVSNVKRLLMYALPDILAALHNGEIRIHRASAWAKVSHYEQRRHLTAFRAEHGIHRTVRRMIKKHKPRQGVICSGLRDIQKGLITLRGSATLSSLISPLDHILDELERSLAPLEEARHAA